MSDPFSPASTPVLRTRQLHVVLGGRQVLHDINLTLHRQEIVTLIGPNGSGKSTLVKALIGAIRPFSGRVDIATSARIGYVPQRLHLDPTLPVSVARFLDLPRRHSRQRVSEALHDAGAGDLRRMAMHHLSGGQFQRVLLARALLMQPDILILDEASQGLDHKGTAAFYEHIDAVRQRYRCAVFMVSHDLHVVMRTANHVVCLNGHICCEGKPERVALSSDYRALFGDHAADSLAFYRHDHEETADVG